MPDNWEVHAAPEELLTPGATLLGVYEILSVLGGGGMGRVYRARHKHLDVLRAIKVIHRNLTGDAEIKRLFVREARILTQINHDAVARCHELLSDPGGSLYLVMELVEGPSLEDVIKTGPLDSRAVQALWQRTAEGLAAIHAMGIVHRDISPRNVILPEGKPERAKLIDFGIASDRAGKTVGVGEFMGTMAYASPEQFGQYGGKVGSRSDIYSLGLVLAEAASGDKVFRTPYEVRIPENIPGKLRDGILKLLEPDPALRPDSALPILETRPVKRPGLDEPPPYRDSAHSTVATSIPSLLSENADPPKRPRTALFVGAGLALVLISAVAWIFGGGRAAESGIPKSPEAAPPVDTERRPVAALAHPQRVDKPKANDTRTIDPQPTRQERSPAQANMPELMLRKEIQGLLIQADAALYKLDYGAAIANYKRVIQLDPQNQTAARGLSSAQARQTQKETQELLAQAKTALDRLDYGVAIAKYERVIQLDPQNETAVGGLKSAQTLKVQCEALKTCGNGK